MYPGRVCVRERERGLSVSQSLSPAHAAKVPSGFDGDGDGDSDHTHAAAVTAWCWWRRRQRRPPVHERARNDGGDEFQGGPDRAPADRTMERKLGKICDDDNPFSSCPARPRPLPPTPILFASAVGQRS